MSHPLAAREVSPIHIFDEPLTREMAEILRHPEGLEKNDEGKVRRPDQPKLWMTEQLYMELYANVLGVVLIGMAVEFQKRHEGSEGQTGKRILAEVPRGGLPASDVWRQMLGVSDQDIVTFDRKKIAKTRKAFREVAQNGDNPELVTQYEALLDGLGESFSSTASTQGEMGDHLILPEDITINGTTLEVLTAAFVKRGVKLGQKNFKVSIVVPTASTKMMRGEHTLLSKIDQIAQHFSVEIQAEILVAYEEDDEYYLQRVSGDKFQDHGRVHAELRNTPEFKDLLTIVALRKEPWAAMAVMQMYTELLERIKKYDTVSSYA